MRVLPPERFSSPLGHCLGELGVTVPCEVSVSALTVGAPYMVHSLTREDSDRVSVQHGSLFVVWSIKAYKSECRVRIKRGVKGE